MYAWDLHIDPNMGPSYRSIHGTMLYREQIEDLSKGPHKTIQTIEDLYIYKVPIQDPYIGNESGTFIRGPSTTLFNHLKPPRTYIIHIYII